MPALAKAGVASGFPSENAAMKKAIGQQRTMVMESTQRIARLTPLEVVLARIDALVRPVAPREVALAAAIGRVLAGDLILPAPPGMALALPDSCAQNSAFTPDASSYPLPPL